MTTFDNHANLAYGTVLTPPSPATSGTTLVLNAGQGALFPAAPFNCTIWPASTNATAGNAEIVRVTTIVGDTLTIVRAQEGTAARTIIATDQIANTITVKCLTDIETAANAAVTPPVTTLTFTDQGTGLPVTVSLVNGAWQFVSLVLFLLIIELSANAATTNYSVMNGGNGNISLPLGAWPHWATNDTAFSNAAVNVSANSYQRNSQNLSNWNALATNSFLSSTTLYQPASANLTNHSLLPTNSWVPANTTSFQPANANLTNFSLLPTNSYLPATTVTGSGNVLSNTTTWFLGITSSNYNTFGGTNFGVDANGNGMIGRVGFTNGLSSILPITTNGAAIPSDHYYDYVAVGTGGTGTYGSSNTVYLHKVIVPCLMYVSNVVFQIITPHTAMTMGLSLYTWDGNKVLDTSVIPSASTMTNIHLQTTQVITQGAYWLAYSMSLTNSAQFRIQAVAANAASLVNFGQPDWAVAGNASSLGTNPATLGTITSFTPVGWPVFTFKN